LPAPVYAHESFHVSTPGSPACGTMWKVQRNCRCGCRTRASPGGPSLFLAESCSSIDDR
jgi:hypothetical protein